MAQEAKALAGQEAKALKYVQGVPDRRPFADALMAAPQVDTLGERPRNYEACKGAVAEALLADLAAAACRREEVRGHPPRRRLQRWRELLDASLARVVARAFRHAHEGTPGRPAPALRALRRR